MLEKKIVILYVTCYAKINSKLVIDLKKSKKPKQQIRLHWHKNIYSYLQHTHTKHINRIKIQVRVEEDICSRYFISNKEVMSRTHEELLPSNVEKGSFI